MNPKFIIKVFLIGLLLESLPQGGSGQVLDLSALGQESLNVEEYVLVFHDPSKKLGLEELPAEKFQSYQEFSVNTNLKEPLAGHIWLRLVLSNSSADTLSSAFYPGLFSEIVFYEKGKVPAENGYYFSNNKSVHPLACIYPIVVLPDSTKVLTTQIQGRVKTDYVKLKLYNPNYLNLYPPPSLINLFSSAPFHLFFFGAVLFVIIFSFIQYFQVGEKAYLYYAIYIFGVFIYFLREFEKFSPEVSLVFTYYPSLDKHFETPIAVYIYCTYVLFFIHFLDIKKHHPVYYKIAKYILIMFISYLIIDKLLWFLVSPDVSMQFYYLFRAICLFAGLYYGYIILKIKTKLSTYVIAGTVCLLIGVGVNLYYSYHLREGNYAISGFWNYPQTYTQLGTMVEIVFFSVGLGYKNRMEIVEKNQALLRALRSQMNPHFIFNCLNSIKTLIYKKDTRNAIRYLTQFAKLFRKVLQFSDKNLITLEEELEMSKLYLNMEKLRFKDQFDLFILVDSHIQLDHIMIPPMIFQPFLENALWHGLLHKEGQRVLSLQIEDREGHIQCSIEDNGIGREKAMKLKKTAELDQGSYGMQLSQERLAYHEIKVTIVDKLDESQNATGTRIEIEIKP